MSGENGTNGAMASILDLAVQMPDDPVVQVLSELVKEIKDLRQGVESLKRDHRRTIQYLKDDIREVRDHARSIPAMKQMLTDLLTRS